jgi:hypothetical protein
VSVGARASRFTLFFVALTLTLTLTKKTEVNLYSFRFVSTRLHSLT